ncbi:MAG: 6-pyruvoyl-tetrahydropterin synthase-related protein [Patescibacteria group bacterium]
MKKVLAILFLSFCISIPVILPFFHTGYFPTHDGEWAIVRLGDMFRTLRDFQIPARYSGSLNFGYGYPLFNFTYPLPYYLGIFIYMLGTGFVGAIRILFASSVLLSAFFMFFASSILWKNKWAGIISAILYIYFPYRMVDLYVRGSIGESLSFVLFPLLFYLAIKLTDKSSFLLIGGIAVSVASLVMAHNIMAVLFMPLYLVFILIQAENKKAVKPLFISIILGFGLSAFFWIPALFEKSNILLAKIPIADRSLYFVTLKQFIFPRWGYGVPTDPNGFSYQLGLVHLAIFIIVVLFLSFLLIKNKKYFKEYSIKIAYILTIITAFFIFLLFRPSEFLWEKIPLLSEINYPWITLGILGFLISLLAGFLSKQVLGRYSMVFLGAIAIFVVLPYAKPQQYINKGDSYYLTNDATTTSSNELMPLWVKKMPLRIAEKKVEIMQGNGDIENIFSNSKQINFSINALTKTDVKVNTIYYPGWKIYVDKISTKISYKNEQGVMEISIPPGRHTVSANFEDTPLRLASNIIALSTFLILLLLVTFGNKSKLLSKYFN